MQNGHDFFANRDCKYYPCHQGLDELNCLFCFCPMYFLENCLGSPEFKESKSGKLIKNCTNCTFPHDPAHYDLILQKLKDQSGFLS